MSRDPALGPKMLAYEFRAAADDIGAVTGARFATDTSTGTRSARGLCVYSDNEAGGGFRRRPSSQVTGLRVRLLLPPRARQ
jgi:hypothetical protein